MDQPAATYHVFINHRGPDVKKTLASLIYHRLTACHGLRVFLDQKELHTGDVLSDAIRGAIESASVHVAIFSEGYAESSWCLDELCWILRCHRKIITVFWDVEPTDLRYIDRENGRYRQAFEEHRRKGRVPVDNIEKWKTALNKASEISGLLFKTNESDLGEVVEKIVKAVLKGAEWESLEVAKYPVGLDPAVKEITDEIKKQSELNGTAIVGIAGMAGVGKSTLAAYLYNMKRSDFIRSCFLSEIKIRRNKLPSLQRKLLRDLLSCDFRIKDTRQGKGIFRDRLGGLQVLIVLDDVDDIEQINSLLVTDVGSRSLILITSRDQDLLRRSSPKTVVYNVQPLQGTHAHELFCLHAFHQSEPYEGFEHLVEKALKICGGLPLFLQVLGGQFLRRHDKAYWEQQLEKFSTNLPRDIINTLTVSYDALSREEKYMFLDIGCFLVGEDKEVAVTVFEGLGYKDVSDCLENLRDKCLVEYHEEVQSDDENKVPTEEPIEIVENFFNSILSDKDSNGNYDYPCLPKRDKITMHDHIRHLARHIASDDFVVPPTRQLRLSSSNDIEGLMLKLQGGAESCLIRGIRIPTGQSLPDHRTNYIKGMGVRLFVVEVPIDLSSLFQKWHMSGDLVWLRLHSFNSICFPDTISLTNLRVLELEGHGDLDQLFHRFHEPPPNLSVLTIDVTGKERRETSCSDPEMIVDTPQQGFRESHFFRFLKWIGMSVKIPRKIVLKNITVLQLLPIAFGELESLTHLDLSGCTNLTHLPNSFSELMHLQILVLRDCIKLSIPVDMLGNMLSLEYVDFKGCSKLKSLPTGIANQKSLRYLNLLCTDLELPLYLELPKTLQRLRVGNIATFSSPFGSLIREAIEAERFGMLESIEGKPFGMLKPLEADAELEAKSFGSLMPTTLQRPPVNIVPLSSHFASLMLESQSYVMEALSKEDAELEAEVLSASMGSLMLESQSYGMEALSKEDAELEAEVFSLSAGMEALSKEEAEELSSSAGMEALSKDEELSSSAAGRGILQGANLESSVSSSFRNCSYNKEASSQIADQGGIINNRKFRLKQELSSSAAGRGILQGTNLRQYLGDLRRLKELKELILIEIHCLQHISWEEIAGSNIKVFVIRNCPISIFSFKEQESMHVGMGVLRDFTLSGTKITSISIADGLLPNLETLDLSENNNLMRVEDLPSTLVRLNLQGCCRLNELIHLSNLVDLKFLCVNQCEQLETLNVEGLRSLEEIQAEACWELKSIPGLSQPERLKCVRISSNTDVIWNDICNFLTWASHEKLSYAFFSGRVAYPDTAFYEMAMAEMQSITGKFKLEVVDVVFVTSPSDHVYGPCVSEFHTKMDDFQSYGAILMCFLTLPVYPRDYRYNSFFRVRFEAGDDGWSADEYKILTPGWPVSRRGLCLHVFMWRGECGLFRDEKGYNNIAISSTFKHDKVKRGWIMIADKNTNVSQICKEIIVALS